MKTRFHKTLRCVVTLTMAAVMLIGLLAVPVRADLYSPQGDPMKVGSIITLGTYEQDNNSRNGKEPIEWIVLDYDASTDCSLVVSRYLLDVVPFKSKKVSAASLSWDNSDIRSWLNGTFMKDNFTRQEQNALRKANVTTKDFLGRSGGKDTKDYFFLLSRQDATKYFSSDKARSTMLTDYAAAQARKYGTDVTRSSTFWWLRSPGGYDYDGSVVDESGAVTYGRNAQGNYGLRPAFWLDLDEYESVQPAFGNSGWSGTPGVNAAMDVGSTVLFGSYEQDNNPRNGAESIEWIVLDYDAATDRSLLISKYILDVRPFKTGKTSASSLNWSASDVRKWLNDEFMDAAFTRAEQGAFCKATNSTKDFLARSGGLDTQDYFFLLSRQEANKYFSSDRDRRSLLTDYAFDQADRFGVSVARSSTFWWLRSPGGYDYDGSVVDESGAITYGKTASNHGGIRPAFWLDLSEVY